MDEEAGTVPGPPTLRREFLRFAVVGLLGLAVDVAVLYCAMTAGLGWLAGRALSFSCAVWVTWQCNRRYTFARRAGVTAWQEWWRYVSAMLVGGATNYGVYGMMMVLLPRSPLLPFAAVAAGSAAGMMVNFLSARYFVFHRST